LSLRRGLVFLLFLEHFFEISIVDDPNRPERIECQKVVVACDKDICFRLYSDFEQVVVVGISARLDAPLGCDELSLAMDEPEHDCAPLVTNESPDLRPSKNILDLSDLPRISNDRNFAALNQG